jgi:PKD repeat protein
MHRSKSALAMLTCAVFMLVAAAPMVSSEDVEPHLIYKDENGPPSTCALSWEITPDGAGTWYGHVINYGMRWLIIDVEDTDTNEMLIDREMYRYAVYGNSFDTDSVYMEAGHTYKVTGTPNGPLDTYCTVEDVFIPDVVLEPPVALMSVTAVNYLEVSVDGSASYDPDGMIVSYEWDFGDGETETGMTATHTYAADGTYTIMLTVTDNDGLIGTTSEPVTVEHEMISPVAEFSVEVDGLTVSVVSTSDDPDGTIVSWDWDWGDGSVGTGEIAAHTYAPPLGGAVETASSPALGIEMPHPILGTCYDIEGNPLPDTEVTVTDVTLGYSGVVFSDSSGMYNFDIANLPGEWAPGDEILVEAVNGPLSGSVTFLATSDYYQIVDVTLEGEPGPVEFDVTITLTVTDNDGQTATVSHTVTLTYYP